MDHVEGFISDGHYLLVSEDGANLLMRSTPIAFDADGQIWVNNHAHILQFEDRNLQTFVRFYINLLDISSLVTGCAQLKLTQANLNKIPIFNVTTGVIYDFASKIEAIEKQKALIKQSITETETLFNSRMDYYFG